MERHFQSVKVQAGDYIQPANDRQSLYRIHRYFEHGDGYWIQPGGKEKQIKGWFWNLYRYDRPVVPGEFDVPDDFLEWDNWTCIETTIPTKKAAIEAAINY